MKHIEVRYHHIREFITRKRPEVRKIDTDVNIADFLTKPLLDQRFGALRTKMGLRQATEQKKAERGGEGKSRSNQSILRGNPKGKNHGGPQTPRNKSLCRERNTRRLEGNRAGARLRLSLNGG